MNQPPPSTSSPGTAARSDTGSVALRPCIVVTGASEGIGLALAHRFAAGTGHTVVMIARRSEPLEAAAAEIAGRSAYSRLRPSKESVGMFAGATRKASVGMFAGATRKASVGMFAGATRKENVQAIPLALDVTADDAADRIEQALADNHLYAEILINNAGTGLGGAFAGHSEADIASLIDLNVRALTTLTRRFLPLMQKRGSGSIINVASLGGFAPGPYQAAYYASKAYVVSLSRALSTETAGTGVHVCSVCPGPVDTQFHARMGADAAFYRHLMPALSAKAVANSAWRGWKLGFYVIHPGLFTPALSLLMRLTPWLLLVPLVGWLLQKRLRS